MQWFHPFLDNANKFHIIKMDAVCNTIKQLVGNSFTINLEESHVMQNNQFMESMMKLIVVGFVVKILYKFFNIVGFTMTLPICQMLVPFAGVVVGGMAMVEYGLTLI